MNSLHGDLLHAEGETTFTQSRCDLRDRLSVSAGIGRTTGRSGASGKPV